MTLRCRVGRSECSTPGDRRSQAGFTLVELLVVIGIIAIMLSILLPTLGRARESARRVQCLSNMRQIAVAMISWAGEHKQFMPGRAGDGVLVWKSDSGAFSAVPGTDPGVKSPADWIAYHRVKDAAGVSIAGADQNITFSALAPYLGAKALQHTTPDQANAVAPNLDSLFRCPSDNINFRPNVGAGKQIIRYSYSMNDFVGNPVQPPRDTSNRGIRSGFLFTGKLSSIRRQSEILLVICEDEWTIDDGVMKPDYFKFVNNMATNAIAGRHEPKLKRAVGLTAGGTKNEDARGNVTFCDGHGEYMSRKDAVSSKYSGSPNNDLTGTYP